MAFSNRPGVWRGPPLLLQILLLLLGGLVVAQAVTLALTLVLPPAPAQQHQLDAVAAALRGQPIEEDRSDRLIRKLQNDPPDISGPSWLVSEHSQRELATLLSTDLANVRLAFYTPLPFAGTLAPRHSEADVLGQLEPVPSARPARMTRGVERSPYLQLAAYDPGGQGAQQSQRGNWPTPQPGSGGSTLTPAYGGSPPVWTQGQGAFPRPSGSGSDLGSGLGISPPIPLGTTSVQTAGGATAVTPIVPLGSTGTTSSTGIGTLTTASPSGIGTFSTASPSGITGPTGATNPVARSPTGQAAPWAADPAIRNPLSTGPSASDRGGDSAVGPSLQQAPEKHELVGPPVSSRPEAVEAAPVSPVVRPKSVAPAVRTPAPSPPVQAERKPAPVVPVRTPQRGLFGLAPAPFVEGDFVAAWRMPNGQWSIVQPAPEPFPNSWQRRLLIWFAVSFALTAPFGWLFARRIVKPLSGFVDAAELLGRDPSAVVRGLDGPAEVGRAARAFNRMQSRLKSFVDDRTAMVGAISHDLRTPLTRLRFRIEDVESEAMRDGMIGEVEEMEQMITSVLAFIRDASTPGVRERLDLGTILDDVVRNVTMIGGDARVEAAQPAPVEVDILGIRRLVTNLVENAVKYGERARIRLRIDQDCAVAEVADDGPGVPEEELERVFEPFYRATNAAGKQGNGLGLAVCRSIARAHGGDVRLLRSDRGFVAQLRIPLYDAA